MLERPLRFETQLCCRSQCRKLGLCLDTHQQHMLFFAFTMLQLTDDEEALKDEEEEAQRLQRQAAEQLQPEDFEQEEDGLEASSSSDEEADTMGAKARQVHKAFCMLHRLQTAQTLAAH